MIKRLIFGAVMLAVLLAWAGGSLKGRLLPYINVPPPQVQINEMLENRGVNNIVFDVRYPKVCGFGDQTFEDRLNTRIVMQVQKAIADAFYQGKRDEKWVFVLRVSDEVTCNRGLLSLRVTDDLDNGGTGFPHTVYYNADIQKSRLLTLDDLFESSAYRAVIDSFIRKRIRSDEHYFVDAFTGVSESTAFFISGGQLHIAFAKYEIASGMTGEPDFAIPTILIRKWLRPEYAPLFW